LKLVANSENNKDNGLPEAISFSLFFPIIFPAFYGDDRWRGLSGDLKESRDHSAGYLQRYPLWDAHVFLIAWEN